MRRCPKCNSFFDNSVEKCVYDGEALVEVQVEVTQTEGLEGKVVNDRYEVNESIGEGGMGMVYKAKDRRSGESIALKVLHRDISGDERTVRRFFSEARVLASLTHPNIIRLYDFGKTDEGLLYIAMELLSGSPVDELIRTGDLALQDAILIVDQTAAALGEAHLQGVIHRDLKPANIFMDRKDDGTVQVTVLDFGIAKIAGSGQNLTATGKVMGTPSYMAPEQIRGGEPDPRTDIYALGAMGYELISGNPPFEADGPIAVLFMHLERPPTPLSTLSLKEKVSGDLSEVIDSFLAKDPADRPRNMMEVRNLLKPFIKGEGGEEAAEPQDLESMKATLVFNSDNAVAEAKARLAAKQLSSAREESPKEAPSNHEAAPAAVPQTSQKEPVTHNPTAAVSRPPERPLIKAPPKEEKGGMSMGVWVGAILVVILLATALAIAVFFFYNISSEKSENSHSPRPAAVAAISAHRLAP